MSKHSEEKILKLGQTLIKELNLEYSVNTLARWLACYIAELIHEVEECNSLEEQAEIKKECCDLILKVWKEKETLPIEKPLDRLKPIIEVLGLLKKREHPFLAFNSFNTRINMSADTSSWSAFLKVVRDNSERVFRKVLLAMLSDEALAKDKEWIKDHGDLIADEEKEVVGFLDSIREIEFQVVDSDKKKLSESEKKKKLFAELEDLIDAQKEMLLVLKQEQLLENNI